LSIDIEGMDYSVLISLDLKRFNIKNIPFEHLHLNFWQRVNIVYKFKKIQNFLLLITPKRIWKRYKLASLK
jgi:hypothetical protein